MASQANPLVSVQALCHPSLRVLYSAVLHIVLSAPRVRLFYRAEVHKAALFMQSCPEEAGGHIFQCRCC